ncbi:hypothetical protein [Rhodobium gokarnense]|uniref:Large-conductance mechanosensitive channel n=1 Tax=Rhodobium gokarnense TaxID=364296 RepID=A0ABT3HG90_9HYPH|nr:hypothetical protein [Rhodobium gokarnense]MCW2309414.1 large-conductance mechanosensitive channel [Rhodobium gokarnense]
MTDMSMDRPAPSLGVGTIIGDSFSIFFRKFPAVIVMALIPTVIGLVISAMLVGWSVTLGLTEVNTSNAGAAAASFFQTLIDQVVYAIATALLVQLAYDAKLKRPLRMGQYISRAFGSALPIAILGLAAGFLAVIAALALIIPGLWVYAVFSVMAPAVVIEGIGFRGLGRSAQLTKGYRWPILGTLVLVGIILVLISLAGGVIIAMIGTSSLFIGAGALALLTAFFMGFGGIVIALIYARLREIKEGVSVDEIASVFD